MCDDWERLRFGSRPGQVVPPHYRILLLKVVLPHYRILLLKVVPSHYRIESLQATPPKNGVLALEVISSDDGVAALPRGAGSKWRETGPKEKGEHQASKPNQHQDDAHNLDVETRNCRFTAPVSAAPTAIRTRLRPILPLLI